jgi:MoxR-like ATPase
VHVADDVRDYLLRLVRSTRSHPDLDLGASPRATLALYRACQAMALLDGRSYVLPDDVKRLAPSVLVHRLSLSAAARLRGATAESVIDVLCRTQPVPVESDSPLIPSPAGGRG